MRREGGRVLATLTRQLGSLELAEDAVQDAVIRALETWPTSGVPEVPSAWLTTVARNRALDRIRRERNRTPKETAAHSMMMPPPGAFPQPDAVEDDVLKLLFTCCHPSIARDAQLVLALKTVCGLTTKEIARAFLVSESTMAQRLVRTKRKIAKAKVPYRVPETEELPDRLEAVLAVVYLMFTEAHHSAGDPDVIRVDLAQEARYLAALLVELMPDEPECLGLQALIEATDARSAARLSPDGHQVLLADQDRKLWDHDAVDLAHRLTERAAGLGRPGPYQYQAAIACLHGDARSFAETDWREIWALYGRLYLINPTLVVAVNAAVAQSYAESPLAALASLDRLSGADHWHFYHVARADCLDRIGRRSEALTALNRALAADLNKADRLILEERRRSILEDGRTQGQNRRR